MLKRVIRLLVPGGQLELVDIDWEPRSKTGYLVADSWVSHWWQALQTASRNFGKPIEYAEDHIRQSLQQAGFTVANHRTEELDVVEDKSLDDNDPQPTRARFCRYLQVHKSLRHLEGLAMALFTRELGWSPTAVLRTCERAVLEINWEHCPQYQVLYAITQCVLKR